MVFMCALKSLLWELPRPVRFLLAGMVNTAVAYALFVLGIYLFSSPLQSLDKATNVVAFISQSYYLVIQWTMWAISVPFAALLLKVYAFQSSGSYIKQTLRSYVVYFPTQLLASALLALFVWFFSSYLGIAVASISVAGRTIDILVLLAQFCTALLIAVLSYAGHKHFTFRPSIPS
jgi:putative flippase GtrA